MPIKRFFVSSYLLWATSHLFKKKAKESKEHGAVDESSSEQQIRESADYTLIVRKNWTPMPSVTGSYGSEAGREMKMF